MKKTMKNQKKSKRFPLWGCKGLLLVALGGLVVVAHAQGVDVCAGTPYTIASTVDASGASTYQWLENGAIISSASAANYTVPANKAVGNYTYIRQAKSAECNEWQSSNEFVVMVFSCSFTAGTETGATATFTDPRDGKTYKTVVMPDGKTWFAQNLNYTKDLTYNAYGYEANGKPYPSENGVSAIGSYWCPVPMKVSEEKGSEFDCRMLGALYSWETAMMVDGKYADDTKSSSVWDESWVSYFYYDAEVEGHGYWTSRARGKEGKSAWDRGRGICPQGWHVPMEEEWVTMFDSVSTVGTGVRWLQWYGTYDHASNAALHLRSSATCSVTDAQVGPWPDTALPAYDTYGFNVLATYHRKSDSVNGSAEASFWAANVTNYKNGKMYVFYPTYASVARWPTIRSAASAIRCVGDN
jgi:uncharacterized protein (TIGR02145 family)